MITRLGAQLWREWAEETRVLAEQMTGEEARQSVLRLANDYDSIADRIEAAEGSEPPPAKSAP